MLPHRTVSFFCLQYEMFNLKNREFTFDVDASNLPCGLNGALYFVEMSEDGGMAAYDDNKAGAKYGTGYCDAQCPHDLKFIDGAANVIDWVPSDTDPNSGTGMYGTCCIEMDIWEANSISQAYTPHTCSVKGQTQCSGSECGDIDPTNPDSRYDGVCDKDGCDLNPYRFGITNFYGPGSDFAVDSTQPMTVITQFITEDGTDNTDLVAIKRIYKQNGKVINSPDIIIGDTTYNAITDDFCQAERDLFSEPHNGFADNGGMKAMGEAFDRGVVLVMSLWDDHYADMLWLDSVHIIKPYISSLFFVPFILSFDPYTFFFFFFFFVLFYFLGLPN
jgi:cellulose 1,4-beta-cellobiosidase